MRSCLIFTLFPKYVVRSHLTLALLFHPLHDDQGAAAAESMASKVKQKKVKQVAQRQNVFRAPNSEIRWVLCDNNTQSQAIGHTSCPLCIPRLHCPQSSPSRSHFCRHLLLPRGCCSTHSCAAGSTRRDDFSCAIWGLHHMVRSASPCRATQRSSAQLSAAQRSSA